MLLTLLRSIGGILLPALIISSFWQLLLITAVGFVPAISEVGTASPLEGPPLLPLTVAVLFLLFRFKIISLIPWDKSVVTLTLLNTFNPLVGLFLGVTMPLEDAPALCCVVSTIKLNLLHFFELPILLMSIGLGISLTLKLPRLSSNVPSSFSIISMVFSSD
ncbi:AAEL013868-PA [Aedes aegypti]|uniref:AAEL013868-PA n=1 Tax=Aedes aegypti TaxID=7159 RepID=Q16HY3_AEDAE|nr:AAEL013868-PA [Aedes aegypti]